MPQSGMPGPASPAAQPPRQDAGAPILLAFAGSGITLIGVALLLLLNPGYGLLPARVGLCLLLTAAMVVAGFLERRRDQRSAGALALVGTGIATSYLTVVGCTSIFNWLPGPMGLLLGSLICAGGCALARYWRSETLACLTVVGCLCLTPYLGAGQSSSLLFCFAVLVSTVSLIAQWGKLWFGFLICRLAPTFLAGLWLSLTNPYTGEPITLLLIASGVLALLGVFGSLWLWPSWPASQRTGTPGGRHAMLMLHAVGLPPLVLPLAFLGLDLQQATGSLLLLALAAVLIGVGYLNSAPDPIRLVCGATGAFALFLGLSRLLDGSHLVTLLLAMALIYLMVSVVSAEAPSYWIGTGLGALAVLGFQGRLADSWRSRLADQFDAEFVLGAVLLIVLIAVWAQASRRRLRRADPVMIDLISWVLLTLAGLVFIVSASCWVAARFGSARVGFYLGHGLASLLWTVAGATFLMVAVRQLAQARASGRLPASGMLVTGPLPPGVPPSPQMLAVHQTMRRINATRGFGLALLIAALTKLIIFDLSQLSDVIRVVVFIVVGLAMLLLGVAYTRALSTASAPQPSGPAQFPAAPHAPQAATDQNRPWPEPPVQHR